MTVKRYAGDKMVGLSTDTKPTNVPDGATFYESDTPALYIKVGGSWIQINTGGGGGGGVSATGTPLNDQLAVWTSASSIEGDPNLTWDGTQMTVTGDVEANEFIGDLRGAVRFKAQAGEALAKGDVVYLSGVNGQTPIVSKADADDAAKMPAFGLVTAATGLGNPCEVITFGTFSGYDTSTPGWSLGDTLYVSTTAGALQNTAPTGESSLIQNIGKVQRVDTTDGRIKVGGAGRTNATPNLDTGKIFAGNASNQAVSTDTLYVDIANSRIGINETSPTNALHIGGTGSIKYGSGPVTELISHSNASYVNLDGQSIAAFRRSGGDSQYFHINGHIGIGFPTSSDTVRLYRDGTDQLALRRNLNPQTFSIYNTYTDASNYERATFEWDSNTFVISPQGLGTGSTARAIRINLGTTGTNGGNNYITGGTNQVLIVAGGAPYLAVGVSEWKVGQWNGLPLTIGTNNQQGVTDRNAQPIVLDVAGGSGAGTAGYFAIKTAPSLTTGITGHTSVERMRIDGDGNVGIGTTSPTHKLTVNGDINITPATSESVNIGLNGSNNHLGLQVWNFGTMRAQYGPYGVRLSNQNSISWSGTTTAGANQTQIAQDSAGIVAFRSGTTPHGLNIYNTYTDASNYERVGLKWNSNVFEIGTEFLGTGTTRQVSILSANSAIHLGGSNSGVNTLTGRFYLSNTGRSTSWAGGDGYIEGVRNSHFAIAVINQERMRIDSTGSMGIGTTNPGNTLHIASAVPAIRLEDTDGGYSTVSGNGAHVTISADVGNTQAGSRIDFDIDGSNVARIDSNGNVGIGTSSPTSPLHVIGNATISSTANIGQISLNGTRGITTNTGNTTMSWRSYGYSTGGNTGHIIGSSSLTSYTNSSGDTVNLSIDNTVNQTGTAGHTDVLINRTETAVGSGNQYLLDAQVGGTSYFKIGNDGKFGRMNNQYSAWTSSQNTIEMGGNGLRIYAYGQEIAGCYGPTTKFHVGKYTGGNYTFLKSEITGTLALEHGTTATGLHLYNTYTDASNYERGILEWDTNELILGTEALGTGTKRDVKVNTNTFVDGDLTFASDGAGANWLKFYRQQGNYWRLTSSGVGDVFTVVGNLITFPQNVLIQRGGLEVQNTIHNTAEPFKGTITFDDAATTFTAFKVNVTDTNSAADSLLIDLQVGGASKFKIEKSGAITQASGNFIAGNDIRLNGAAAANINWNATGSGYPVIGRLGNAGATMVINPGNSWNNTLSIANSTNAQTLNIYNTYTDTSNYERASLKWDTNVFKLSSEALGTGSLREIEVFAATKTTFKSNNGSGYLELSGANTPYFTAFQSTGKRGAYGPLNLTFSDVGAANPVQLGKSDTVTTTSTTATTIVSFVTSFKGAKLVIQAADTVTGERQMSEILLVHDGTTVTLTEYGIIYTNASLATYSASISGGNVIVQATSASTNSTTYKVMQTLI